MVYIAGVASALPPHRYEQSEITEAFRTVVLGDAPDPAASALLTRLHVATEVRTRALAMPLSEYGPLIGFGEANDAYVRVATELGEQALQLALKRAGLDPADVDIILTTSITGVAAPSIDARLVARVGLRPDVRRLPIFGLGCVGGAAGLGRVRDLLVGDPDGVAVLLAVELCSLTVQREDRSLPNLVASGLFADGAAAVVVVGERRARHLGCKAPAIVATRSRFYPDTERVMGWDIGASGFRIVLSPTVPDVVRKHLGEDVRAFLDDVSVSAKDVSAWIAHPGGPKVLTAMQEALDLSDTALDLTRQSLAEVGNMSSVSVLEVLERTLDQRPPARGAHGILLAMGPGFCAELVLLRW